MTKQDFSHIYGQSVYATRLSMAASIYAGSAHDARKALEYADEFIEALLAEDRSQVENLFEH